MMRTFASGRDVVLETRVSVLRLNFESLVLGLECPSLVLGLENLRFGLDLGLQSLGLE